MTYYDVIVRLLNLIHNSMFYFDNIDIGEQSRERLENIEKKIHELQTSMNWQVAEFQDWILARKKGL